jgi:hypothetical protein
MAPQVSTPTEPRAGKVPRPMNHHSIPTHRLADDAVKALRHFGFLTRTEAAKLLPMWGRYNTLTVADVQAVLAQFPGADDMAAVASLARTMRQVQA